MTTLEAPSTYPPGHTETFYDRRVWPIGEDGDEGVIVQGQDRRAYAALSRYVRQERIDVEFDPEARRIARLHTECGCTPERHGRHLYDDIECSLDCDHHGLPPCDERFMWIPEYARAHEPGGLPVLWVRW